MFEGLRNSIILDNLIRIRNQEREIEQEGREEDSYDNEEAESPELS